MAHHKHLHRRQHGGYHNSHLILNRDSKDKDTKAEQGSPKVATIVSVVYVTAAPTFNGPVGGYTTLAPVGAPLQASSAKSPPPIAAPSSSPAKAPSSVIPQPSIQPTMAQSDIPASADASSVAPSSAPPSSVAMDSTVALSSSITMDSPVLSSIASSTSSSTTPFRTSSSTLLATSSDISSSSAFAVASATASPSASPTTSPATTSGGMSGGAKAGLAFGLLFGIGAILALVLFCYRRKKKQNKSYEKTDDEKSAFNSNSVTFGAARPPSTGTTRTSATAPRLSLRPVTQFYPDLGERRKSGNLLASTPAVTGAAGPGLNTPAAELPSSSESQGGRSPSSPSSSSNPFGDHAENPAPTLQAVGSTPAASLAPGTQAATPGIVENPHSRDLAVAGGAVAAGVLTSHQHAPKPLHINPNSSTSTAPVPSPAGTEFSVNSTTPDTAPAVGPHSSNVHRVQLDFRPSMDDELELRAGQLVRLLHEYDDGWALCIRLDRSQQGVAPRTCLSTRPVKPRPAGTGAARGAPPPNLRKPPIQSAAGASVPRSMSPASGRNSPSPRLYDQSPRSMSPGPFAQQPRSMSPGPYHHGGGPQRPPTSPGGRNRSNSASQVRDRRNSPPGPSPMNPNAKAQQRLPVQLTAGSPQPQASPPTSMRRKPVPGQAI